MRCLLLLLLAALTCCKGANVKHHSFLDRLVPIIQKAIERKDTDHAVFHGCYDWHSAVHGHWALLRIARSTRKHQGAVQAVERSLRPEGLRKEAELLAAKPEFELPYGRAWLLRLAIEWEQSTAKDKERLRSLGDQAAHSLIQYYITRLPTRLSAEYKNDAWALRQLHAWLRHRGESAQALKKIDGWIHSSFVKPVDGPTFAEDAKRPEFFSRFGNWVYLVLETQDEPTRKAFLEAHPIPDQDLVPVAVGPKAIHHLGMNWSRAWALKSLLRHTTDAGARKKLQAAFDAHVEAGTKAHAERVGEYLAYDHWVPQFAVYALTD